ncbi:spermidine synthase [Marinobacter daepoensis]|uniref:spermidine synthase n=1 Tax=Marinobacter daepoensis TaxID=262077 RepID=UPI001C95026B|nr:spermidine synthase [Marinobacter daepoensis]MBY6033372.1 spermidine synthase [Marinobacter daepoensis]
MGTIIKRPEIKGDIVHVASDRYGNILVIDDRKHRILSFDSVFEQSKIRRQFPHLPVHEYSRAMLLPAVFSTPEHITILGLGAGVITHGLYRLLPEARLHVVELREKVVEIAQEWFSLPKDDRLTLTVADARLAIEAMPEASTHLILTDLYSADRMSPLQSQRRFIKDCARALAPNGWLVLNYHRMPEQDGTLFRELKRQFPCLLAFKSKTNNWVIYGCNRPFDPWRLPDRAFKSMEAQLPIGWLAIMKKVRSLAAPASL